MIPYSIDFNALSRKIRDMGFSKILLQLPEGMQIYAQEIADMLGDFEVLISANPCYGACDVETYEGMLTLQFGHSRIPNINYPENVIFVESFSSASFENVLDSFARSTSCRKIGIVASIQHVKAIETARRFLEDRGFLVGVGRGDSRITYPGQVLGCNFSAAREVGDVDCFVFLGTGEFHGLGVKIATGKDVYVLDPYSERITEIDANRFIRQRYAAIARARDAKKFGIILSTKIGQRRWKLAKMVAKEIEISGRQAYFIMTNNIMPEQLYYKVDAYVNTACPRITYDDFSRFNKVVLTPMEALMAIGKRSMENIPFDEIVEVD